MRPEDGLSPLTGVQDATTPLGLKTPQTSLRSRLGPRGRARTGVQPGARGAILYSRSLPHRSNFIVCCPVTASPPTQSPRRPTPDSCALGEGCPAGRPRRYSYLLPPLCCTLVSPRRLAPWRAIPRATGTAHRFKSFLDGHQYRSLLRLESPAARHCQGDCRDARIVRQFHYQDYIILSKGIVCAEKPATLGLDHRPHDFHAVLWVPDLGASLLYAPWNI
jgi:hypothetical protein